MQKTIFVGIAAALISTAAFAQSTAPSMPTPQPGPASSSMPAPTGTDIYYRLTPSWSSTGYRSSEFIGKAVYNSRDERIGEIEDVIIANDGKISGVVLGVGGFLGIGERKVAVMPSAISFVRDGNTVKYRVNVSREELSKAPEFRWTAS